MKHKKRFFSMFLVIAMIISLFPMQQAMAAQNSKPVIQVESTVARPGETINVDVVIKNNTGVLGATLKVEFDSRLKLTSAQNGAAFSHLTMTKPGMFVSPCQFVWDGMEYSASDIRDGEILTLTFEVADDVENGDELNISVTAPSGDIYDNDLDVVDVETVSGKVSIVTYIPGDVNGDQVINTADIILTRRYIVGGYDISIIEEAANVNGDDRINSADIILLRRYIAGGYDVELLPGPSNGGEKPHVHQMKAVAQKAATCIEKGHISYWECTSCGKLYADENGMSEIGLESTVLAPTGHTPEEIPAVAPTTTSTGLTAGARCSICKTVLKEQEEIPMLQGEARAISYDIANGDPYLMGLVIQNTNPAVVSTSESVPLKSVSVPGYQFLGWYDLAGENGELVRRIEAGEDDIELFAHWKKITYTVQFESSLQRAEFPSQMTYTVDTGKVLPKLSLSNYVFAGWSDSDGKLYDRIPAGTTGNIILQANWTSERNKTWTKSKLGKPVIVEDDEDGFIFFAYEIGTIENIPLYTVHDFGYISDDGITKTHTETYSVKTSETMMESYAKTVADATTNSSSWTLSNEWNKNTSVNNSWMKEKGYTQEQIDTMAKTNSTNWNVSSGTSGSSSSTTTASNSNSEANEVKLGTSQSVGEKKSMSASLNTSETASVESSVSASMKAEMPGVGSAGVESSLKAGVSSTVSENLTSTKENDYTKNNSLDIGKNNSVVKTVSNSSTSTASWNSSSSYGGSSSSSVSSTAARALSESIAETYGYGQSYGSSTGTAQYDGVSKQYSNEEEYSSVVTFSTETQRQVTESWTTQNTKAGYHRWIKVGKAHVFGVVGYDISNDAFFVSTYSVMDDEIKDFEDYSLTTSSFNDNQNGVISFEVPTDVVEYVANRVVATKGLKISESTGMITGYDGNDDVIIIPEYISVKNADNTNHTVKVTGISEKAFKGNTFIKAMVLSDYITEIPANAFAGCTSLYGVAGSGIQKIGERAFAGCTNFVEADLSYDVVSVGRDAFDGVDTLYVFAANADVAKNAMTSDVKEMALYLKELNDSDHNNALSGAVLETPDTVQKLTFNGFDGIFTNTSLITNAPQTTISRCNFVSTEGIPLQLSSDHVILDKVNVTADGIGMVLSAPVTEVGLQGDVRIATNNSNAVLCKNLKLYESNDKASGILTVDGSLIVCGTIEGMQYLRCSSIQYVDEETFDRLMHSYMLRFDANQGTCNLQYREVPNCTAVGELPVPTRENFDFAGWYTEAVGGTLVTRDTVFTSMNDVTIYARWTPKEYTAVWQNGKGYTISVSRTASPYAEASIGELQSGTIVYYGDVLSISYAETTGFELTGRGQSSITVVGNVTCDEIYASAAGLAYTASWTGGTGYTITVTRTSSPYYGAATGELRAGDTVYYGDELSVAYTASAGYTLGNSGKTIITVEGDVTSDDIYTSATANKYTYTITYRSSNGTNLGSTTATYAFGTTNTISAPAKTGYTTPAAQTVAWDSTSAKTIVFTYAIKPVSGAQTVASGNWYVWDGKYGITYSADAEIQNRTASSVQIRIKWTNVMLKNSYYGFAQYFTGNIGGTSTGEKQIAASSTWTSYVSYDRYATVYSGWITVPVSATQTSVSISASFRDVNGKKGSWSSSVAIPTY